jgi:mannose-6-phosphate isomerase-like protein (cupin superfamily)
MAGNYPDRIRALELFDGHFDAYKLKSDCCDVLFANYPVGTSISPHTHDTDNYGVIIRGELILTMNSEVTRYGVGDWYHIPAHVEHAADFEVETDEIEIWFKQD